MIGIRRAALGAAVVALSVAAPATAMGQDTVVEFDQAVPLSEVQAALTSGSLTIKELRHTGAGEGGFLVDPGVPVAQSLQDYRADYSILHPDAGEPRISEMTVDGPAAPTNLGQLGNRVASITGAPASPGDTDQPAWLSAEEPSADNPLLPDLFALDEQWESGQSMSSDQIAASEANAAAAPSAERFAPLFGQTTTATNFVGSGRNYIKQTLTWAQGTLGAFNRTGAPDYAYEHDMKLFNPAYRSRPNSHPFCFNERENHWATRTGLTWSTNFPASSRPYLEDNLGDACNQMDLTIGMIYPKDLTERRTYQTNILTRRGARASSRYQLVAQKAARICYGNHPNCVVTAALGSESQLLIGNTRGLAPECRRWRKGQSSSKCLASTPGDTQTN